MIRRVCRRLGLVATMVFGVLAAATAQAEDAQVSVSSVPAALDLCPAAGAGRVLAVVRNGTAAEIRNVCLSVFSNGPVTVTGDGKTLFPTPAADAAPSGKATDCNGIAIGKLGAGAVVTKPLAVTLSSYPTTSAALYLQARYDTGEAKAAISAAATSALDVRANASPAPDGLKVEARTAFASLHEGETGRLVVTVTNATNDTVGIQVTPSQPLFAKVQAPSASAPAPVPASVPPQSAVSLNYDVIAAAQVAPGKYIGLVDLQATTSCKAEIHRVVAYDLALGVYGQSDILTTLGVPSLLLLPGFLMVATWMLIWRWKALRVSWFSKATGEEFFVGVKDPEFWFLAITISLIVFALAPLLTKVRIAFATGFGTPYSLTDIARTWAISIGVGALVYFVLFGGNRWLEYRAASKAAKEQARETAERGKKTMTKTDDVLTAVERMAARRWEIRERRPVHLKGSSKARGFALWADDSPQDGLCWVIPQIRWHKPEEGADDLDPGGAKDTAKLFADLQCIREGRHGRLEFSDELGARAPHLFKLDELEDASGLTELVATVPTV